MTDSGFVPPREWHWSAWLLLSIAMLIGLACGYWLALTRDRLDIDAVREEVAKAEQTQELGEQIGSVDVDLQLRQDFQKEYRELQEGDIERLASEKYNEQLLEYEANKKTQLQLLQSEAEEAFVSGRWSNNQTGAVPLYRQILEADPENEIARERRKTMEQRLLQRSQKYQEKGDFAAAMEDAVNAFEVRSGDAALQRIKELAEIGAAQKLLGQVNDDATQQILSDAEQRLSGGDSDFDGLKSGIEGVNEYRNHLGVQYTPDWAAESAEQVRERGLSVIANNPDSNYGYELLQLASALDGKYVELPPRQVATDGQIDQAELANSDNTNESSRGGVSQGGAAVIPNTSEQDSSAAPRSNESGVNTNSQSFGNWNSGYNNFISGNLGQAREDFERAINDNQDPRARFYLALMYGEGMGVSQNTVRAQQYLSQSAAAIRSSLDRQESWAQFAQGVMYEKGWLVQQDNDQAMDSYVVAAQAGDVEAQYRLGQLMQRVGGTRAGRNGAEWLTLAIGNGHGGR